MPERDLDSTLVCESGRKLKSARQDLENLIDAAKGVAARIRRIEEDLLEACETDDPGPDPDPILADAISVGVAKGWRPQKFAVVADPITDVRAMNRDPFVINWRDPVGSDFPLGGDFGPSDPGRFGRVYIVARNRRDRKLYTWGIEWLRVEGERFGTSIGAWEGKTMIETLIAKAKGNGLPDDFEFEPNGQVGIYLGNPETRKRTPVRWKEFRG